MNPAGTSDNQQSQNPKTPSPDNGVSVSDAAGAGVEMFQEWCLRTYGDSGKTKTVTRRKYNKIIQTLKHLEDDHRGWIFREKNTINAKFKFWVKSKGFQVGSLQEGVGGSPDRAVLFVPIKATVSASSSFTFTGPLCALCKWVPFNGVCARVYQPICLRT